MLTPALAALRLSLWELKPLENAIARTEPAINKHFKTEDAKFGRHVVQDSTIQATIFAKPAQPTVLLALTVLVSALLASSVTKQKLPMHFHSHSISQTTHAPALVHLTTTLSNSVSHVPEIA